MRDVGVVHLWVVCGWCGCGQYLGGLCSACLPVTVCVRVCKDVNLFPIQVDVCRVFPTLPSVGCVQADQEKQHEEDL